MHTDAPSALTHLEGSASGETYDADQLIGLDPADGRPLLARYDLERAAATLTREALAARRAGGLWRWAELLPVRDPAHRIHLGEGATPLLPAPRLGRELGVPGLRIKDEGLNPTGSFKARGMAAAVSRAAELGATALVAPSAGNAGGALAAYGAAAGLPVTVVMPRDVPAVNRDEAAVMGARVILLDGLIDECGAVAREIAAETGGFDVSTLKEPYRVEGKKTMGLELAEQLGWRAARRRRLPDRRRHRPRRHVEGVRRARGARADRPGAPADGLRPGRGLRADRARLRDGGGDRRALGGRGHARRRPARARGGRRQADPGRAARVRRDRGRGERGRADRGAGARRARLMGSYIAPESGAALAAVRVLRERGDVGASEDVVVFDCGIGQKYPPRQGSVNCGWVGERGSHPRRRDRSCSV